MSRTQPARLDDAACMRRALQLAARGAGLVEPNPMVGCVIVRDGRIIGEGYHRRFGGPHAEVEALRNCTESPRGATVFVTLEPCCYHGKTPPCTNALIAARVRRVVAAMRDPNPLVSGGGLEALRAAHIRTSVGLLAEEAAALNAPFIKYVMERRPWVILKWAQSLDGKIATRTGDSRWISDEVMRAHAHRMRGRLDAILIGIGTALRDDPLLTCRGSRPRRVAARVVLDSQLRLPPKSQLARTARQFPTWVFCANRAPAARMRTLEKAGVVVRPIRRNAQGLSLVAVLDALGAAGMTNVLVEGGGALLGRFFDQRLADEVRIYLAPLLVGGAEGVGPLHSLGPGKIAEALRLPGPTHPRPLGGGWLIQARLWQGS